jgi:hypothetical protein
MNKIIISLLLAGIAFASCKKNRTCECKNSNSTYDAGDVDGTKSYAKKYCKDLSSGDTQCYLKN